MTEAAALIMIMLSLFAIGCFQSEKEAAELELDRQKNKNKILLYMIRNMIRTLEDQGVIVNEDLKDAVQREIK